MLDRYTYVSPEAAKPIWDALYKSSGETCMHGPGCKLGPDCTVGRRRTRTTLLTGSVVPCWGALEVRGAASKGEGRGSHSLECTLPASAC